MYHAPREGSDMVGSRLYSRGTVLVAVAMLVFVATGCGGGGGGDTGGGGGGETAEVELTTQDNVFEPKELSVPAGAEVTVTVTNDGESPHTFTSEDLGFDETVDPGASTDVTFTAPDADSEFVCTFHESQGMTGTIVVE
jgi:plastocyanin